MDMNREDIFKRLDAVSYYLNRTDLSKEQREKAEKRRDELRKALNDIEQSDERVTNSIQAIREMLKKDHKTILRG